MSLITNAKQSKRPLSGLTKRHREIINLMVWGDNGKGFGMKAVAEITSTPLRTIQAIIRDPTVRSELAASIATKRAALAPSAVDKLGELLDDESGSVALGAAKAILGDEAKSPAVSVTVANQVNVAPRGYAYAPCNRDKVIEGEK